jgi:hypothetical protein
LSPEKLDRRRAELLAYEQDPSVRAEWDIAPGDSD